MVVNLVSGRAVLGLAAALALLAMILFLGLSDVAAGAATPKTDFAKGKGTASANDPGSQNIHFKFNVQASDNDPSTNAAKGSFSLKQGKKSSPTGKKRYVQGSVSCLDIASVASGEAANFAGAVKKTNVPDVKNGFFDFEVVDTGSSGGVGDTLSLNTPPSAQCQAPTGNNGVPLTKGNIVVKSG